MFWLVMLLDRIILFGPEKERHCGPGALNRTFAISSYKRGTHGRVPPMPWLKDPIATPFRLEAAGATAAGDTRHALFAAGFGGHTAGAVMQCQSGLDHV